jgi:hypothetical protein
VNAAQTGPVAGAVRLRTTDGRQLAASADTSIPAADLERQGKRLTAKFTALADPVVGRDRASMIAEIVDRFEDVGRVHELTKLLGS